MSAHDLSRVALLVVEDDLELRDMLATLLRSMNAEVRVAGDGFEALATLGLWEPDLIICDIQMPAMDGCAFVQELKAREEYRHIPVVAISGRGSPPSLVASMEAGFAAHMVKPVTPGALHSQIRRLVPEAPRP